MSEERDERLRRLGVLLQQARAKQGGWPITSVQQRAGISKAQWYNLTAGQVPTPQMGTLASLERAFDWPSGSISAFLDGGPEPGQPTSEVVDITDPGDREQLLAAVRRELTTDERRELRRQLLQLLVDTERDTGAPHE